MPPRTRHPAAALAGSRAPSTSWCSPVWRKNRNAGPSRLGSSRSDWRRWTACRSGRRSGPRGGGPSVCRWRWRDSVARASMRVMRPLPFRLVLGLAILTAVPASASAQQRPQTQKPPLHARHWIAITGKPLGATAGAMMFARGGNAVDAACAMLGAVTTMWDVLSWGGETQALIYHPKLKKVIGIDALGVAPTGATAGFYRSRGDEYPPEYGPLAAITPGTPGGLMTMLAEYGTLSLADVLAPAIQMADGYPIEAQTADEIEAEKARIKQWKYSTTVFLPHRGRRAGGTGCRRDLRAARPRRH